VRLPKNFVIYGLALSFLGCAGGPKVTPCVLSPSQGVAYCAPASGGDVVDKPISEMSNYICHSPDDYQAIIEWIKRHGGRK
jgi:hypothetical protein